jgi:hypothetical protein
MIQIIRFVFFWNKLVTLRDFRFVAEWIRVLSLEVMHFHQRLGELTLKSPKARIASYNRDHCSKSFRIESSPKKSPHMIQIICKRHPFFHSDVNPRGVGLSGQEGAMSGRDNHTGRGPTVLSTTQTGAVG